MWSTCYFIHSKTLCYNVVGGYGMVMLVLVLVLYRIIHLCCQPLLAPPPPLLLFTSKSTAAVAVAAHYRLWLVQSAKPKCTFSKVYSIFCVCVSVYNQLRMNRNKSSRVILDVCRLFSIHMWKCTLHISLNTLGNISSELQLIENETLLTFTLPMLFYGCLCVSVCLSLFIASQRVYAILSALFVSWNHT